MKRRFLPILLILALCLSLLPVTALANAPSGQVLYVGGVQISNTGYWTTGSNGSVTPYTEGGKPTENYIHYDADTNILTLHNAIIKDELPDTDTPAGSFINGAAIGVLNQDGNAALTIQLEGDNTIEDVSTGIYVLAPSPSTSAASLTITGSGSLTASGNTNGIKVQSNSGDAILGINNAKVTATSKHGIGVSVQAYSGSSASLSVEGGSLTASGASERKGIHFPEESPQLNISESAIVRASGGIAAGINEDDPVTPSGVGIVFNDKVGTVYGSVTLQEDLTIGEDESLTLDDGASLNANGHNVIVDGGTLDDGLEEALGDNVKYPPTITTASLPNGEVGKIYNQTLEATGSDTITWSVTSGSLPAGLTLNNGGMITGTPTAQGESTFTVTATNGYGDGDSEALSITINPAALSITTQPSNQSVTAGQTATFSVVATGSNLTYQWQQSTDNGSIWMDISSATSSSYTTQTATMVMNGYQYRCVVTGNGGSVTSDAATLTVTAATVPVTGVTLNKTSTSLYVGDTETLTPTITPDNATNKNLTWSSDDTSVATVDASGLVTAVSAGTATITVTTEDGAKTATCTVTVSRYSSGGGSSSSSTSLSDRAIDDIQDARPGDTVEITLRPGRTTLEREVFEELAGRDVTLEISLSNGITWTVNGQDIPENADLTDLDLGVTLDASTIPVSVVNTITGAVDTIQISLKHDGEFGFTMTLSAPLGKTNAGYWANLYYYNEDSRALEFQSADKIASDGTAEFAFSHASDYAIVIDTDSHEPVELPFTDVPEGAWYEDAAAYVYKHGLMAGTSATTFAPDVTTSRAMIATILWRMAGSPVVNYAMNYTDVTQGQWCSEAIRWATSEGVVTGYGNGLFGTNDPITREQLATMLWRYAQTEGYDVSIGENTNILSYTDVADLSEYAIPAMQWAVGAGIINGTGDGSTLTPQGQATRAQAAVMLMRFCEEYVTW